MEIRNGKTTKTEITPEMARKHQEILEAILVPDIKREKGETKMREFIAYDQETETEHICDTVAGFAMDHQMDTDPIYECLNGTRIAYRGWLFEWAENPVEVPCR